MPNTQHYIPGVLIWGGVFGLICGIPCVNFCCCMWTLGAGLLAVMSVNNKATSPIGAGEGAVIGLISGGIAGLIGGFASGIFQAVSGPALVAYMESMPPGSLPPGVLEQYRAALSASSPILQGLQTLCIFIVAAPAFGAIGGLIGSAVFKPKVGGMNAGGPPPQVF